MFEKRQGLKPIYELSDGKCRIIVPAAREYGKPEHYSAYILSATLDLMRQNRYSSAENMPSINSLLLARATVFNTIHPKLKNLTNEQLIAKYTNMINDTKYPEFVSLVAFLYAKEFQKRNIQNIPVIQINH